eukprot:c9113_g1_i1.p1 GENE.c9113_g1_i1~~c9113_g1_i1.p1  ORF type:complete len:360 (+),score=93.10 c9113_g1_i1:42-1121(+)
MFNNAHSQKNEAQEIAEALQRAAVVSDMQGNTDDAMQAWLEAQAIYESDPSTAESAGLANVLQHIAGAYDGQGNHDSAEKLLTRALAMIEKIAGLGHVSSANVLHSIGCCLDAQGQNRWLEAEIAFRKSIAVRREAAKPPGDGLTCAVSALTLHSLAELYAKQSNIQQAIPLLRKAVKIRSQIFGANSLEVSQTQSRIDFLSAKVNSAENNSNASSRFTASWSTINAELSALSNAQRSGSMKGVAAGLESAISLSSPTIAERACAAVSRCGTSNLEWVEELVALGAVKHVIALMKAHAGVVGVQLRGCAALGSLASCSAGAQQVLEFGGLDVLKSARQRFPSHGFLDATANDTLKALGH